MKSRPDNHPTFSFLPVITARGDGSYTVTPGKPLQWADTELAAKHLQLDGSTLRGWIQRGTLPESLPDGTPVYRKRSPKLWEFNLPAIEQLRSEWKKSALA